MYYKLSCNKIEDVNPTNLQTRGEEHVRVSKHSVSIYMPEGMVFQENPNESSARGGGEKRERRARTDWERVEKALAARPGEWALIAREQPSKSIMYSVRRGAIKHLQAPRYEVDAHKVRAGAWDIYARLVPMPPGVNYRTFDPEVQAVVHEWQDWVNAQHQLWREKWQGEWEEHARKHYKYEWEKATEHARGEIERGLYG